MVKISERRRRGQRGNAFVEFGLSMLPYFALVFGILDFGMAVFIDNMIQSAVREGVRYAITYKDDFNSVCSTSPLTKSQTCAIKEAAKSVSMGFLSGTTNAAYLQVNYYAPTDLSTKLTSNQNAPGNVVEVRVQGFPWNWMVPLPGYMVGPGVTMTASATDVLPAFGGTLPTP